MEDVSVGFVVRIVLSLIAAGILYILLSRRGDPSRPAKQTKAKVSKKSRSPASKSVHDSESEFSDEPDHPLQESDDEEDPGAALERLPRVKLDHQPMEAEQMCRKAREFYELMNKRRTVRTFSTRPVPLEAVENIVRVAGTSPSGAHTEPWTYVVVGDPVMKGQVRQIIEREEEVNYDRRMGSAWVKDVALLGTDFSKPYLEEAPYLIIAFEQTSGVRPDGKKQHHYYSRLSASISAGMLLTAIHYAGLVTVTSTPLNAYGALRDLFGRPKTEKAFLVLPIGYPSEDATVPDLVRKPLDEIMLLK